MSDDEGLGDLFAQGDTQTATSAEEAVDYPLQMLKVDRVAIQHEGRTWPGFTPRYDLFTRAPHVATIHRRRGLIEPWACDRTGTTPSRVAEACLGEHALHAGECAEAHSCTTHEELNDTSRTRRPQPCAQESNVADDNDNNINEEETEEEQQQQQHDVASWQPAPFVSFTATSITVCGDTSCGMQPSICSSASMRV